jgi:hypothetical protein
MKTDYSLNRFNISYDENHLFKYFNNDTSVYTDLYTTAEAERS